MTDHHQSALISVSDKHGLVELAKRLELLNIRLIASGGTANLIRMNGIDVVDVSVITESPEILGGRVKTLHPAVHGGLLARNTAADDQDIAEHKISKIDYCICNLYQFEQEIAKKDVSIEDAIDKIDIGGVALLRAAAKNFNRVTVVCSPFQYPSFLEELEYSKSISEKTRQLYALKAFELTSDYDAAISSYYRQSIIGETCGSNDSNLHPNVPHQIQLRYGTNPHQKPAFAFTKFGPLPFKIINGSPSYLNLLDALNSWALVKELKSALNCPAAASFKHVSPAGAAIGIPLSEDEKKVYMMDGIPNLNSSLLACAYARARGADRVSSFGDIVGLSEVVDFTTAQIISREVSDGIITPGYEPEALEILKKKKKGQFLILQMDGNFECGNSTGIPSIESRQVHGVTLTQAHNTVKITPQSFRSLRTCNSIFPRGLPQSALRDLTVAAIALKYTQSNSVCFAKNGQTIGLGAGQQSRIHVTSLAARKVDGWWSRFHPKFANLQFSKTSKRPERTNAVDLLCNPDWSLESLSEEELLAFESTLDSSSKIPTRLTPDEQIEWSTKLDGVAMVSDAFFPFSDNVNRAAACGTAFMSAPLGSVNDELVLKTSEHKRIAFVELPVRLFVH